MKKLLVSPQTSKFLFPIKKTFNNRNVSSVLFHNQYKFNLFPIQTKHYSENIIRDYTPLTLLDPPIEPEIQEIKQQQDNSKKKNVFSFYFDRSTIDALQSLSIVTPSTIQELAITQLLSKVNKKKHFCIGAQTGTGKTLSYLLPILRKMKLQEEREKQQLKEEIKEITKEEEDSLKRKPKFIIISPTRELSSQIYRVVKHLSHFMKFRSVCLRSDFPKSKLKKQLDTKLDIIISTPKIFNEMHELGYIHYTNIQYIVMDEADTLLGKDFLKDIEKITISSIERGKLINEFVQFGFVFATYNINIQRFLNYYFGGEYELKKLQLLEKKNMTTNVKDKQEDKKKGSSSSGDTSLNNVVHIIDKKIHKGLTHLNTRFITLSNEDKIKYLLERIIKIKLLIESRNRKKALLEEEDGSKRKRSIRLVMEDNEEEGELEEDEMIEEEEDFVIHSEGDNNEEEGLIPVNPASKKRILIFCNTIKSCRAVHHALREKGVEASCFHGDMPHEKQTEEFDSFSSGRINIMVTTDIASRGLDLIVPVGHVVMFDFPLNAIDYMHRAGRTGRMGTSGNVTCLLNRKKEKLLAETIHYALRLELPLSNLNSENAGERLKEMKKSAKQKKEEEEEKKKRFIKKEPITVPNPTQFTKKGKKNNLF
ncbi:hypothetical protein ABK040_005493 [Willaertia magna]